MNLNSLQKRVQLLLSLNRSLQILVYMFALTDHVLEVFPNSVLIIV